MARRGGKAANRRDRQRRAQRRAQQRPAQAPRPAASTLSEAVEAAAEQRAAAPAPSATPLTRGARSDPRFAVGGPSRLGERAAAEYHYVGRDLRNIAVLIAIMAVLLGAAVVAFSALGIGPS